MAGGYNTYKAQVSLTYDGNVTWLNPAIFKSVCQIDVTYFPFDEQICEMKFGSWSYDMRRIDVYPKPDYTGLNKNYITNGEWELRQITAKRNEKKYSCCPYKFVDVTIRFHIRRESIDYILKLIIPCALISSMIFLGFILPPESGERIGLSITVLLAMTVFQQFTSEIMPAYGFPLLSQYYFATIIQIGLSLLVTTAILNFYHRNKIRMPKLLRKIINEWIFRMVFPSKWRKNWRPGRPKCGNCPSTQWRKEVSFSDHSYKHTNTEVDNKADKDDYSVTPDLCAFDPWIKMEDYKKQQEEKEKSSCTEKLLKSEYREEQTAIDHELQVERTSTRNSRPGVSHNHLRVHRTDSQREHQARRGSFRFDRFDGLRRSQSQRKASCMSTGLPNSLILAAMDLTDEQVEHQEEWMKAARVLDRLFLILSIASGAITLLAIFLKAPRFANTG